VLSTPPAFVLSQDQTLHKFHEETDPANSKLKLTPQPQKVEAQTTKNGTNILSAHC